MKCQKQVFTRFHCLSLRKQIGILTGHFGIAVNLCNSNHFMPTSDEFRITIITILTMMKVMSDFMSHNGVLMEIYT